MQHQRRLDHTLLVLQKAFPTSASWQHSNCETGSSETTAVAVQSTAALLPTYPTLQMEAEVVCTSSGTEGAVTDSQHDASATSSCFIRAAVSVVQLRTVQKQVVHSTHLTPCAADFQSMY